MEDIRNQSTHMEPVRSSARRRKAHKISHEEQQVVRTLFDEFKLSYTGKMNSEEIIGEFIRKYPYLSYLRDISRTYLHRIIGPFSFDEMRKTPKYLSQQNMGIAYSFEETKRLFHQFLMSYKYPIKFRTCLSAFIDTDENLRFLNELCDANINKILGSVEEWKDVKSMMGVLSDVADDHFPLEQHEDHGREGKKRARNASADEFPEKLYHFMEVNPSLYQKSRFARSIDGEDEWVQSEFLKIIRQSCVQNCNDLIAKFVDAYPKLDFYKRINPSLFRERFGNFDDLRDGKVIPRKRAKLHVESGSRIYRHRNLQAPFDDLSPESRRDIESALCDDSDVITAQSASVEPTVGVQPSLCMSHNTHMSTGQTTGERGAITSNDAFLQEFGDVRFDSSLSVSGLSCFDSNELSGIELFDSPRPISPRRSPRFSSSVARASTPPVQELRRSPRLAKKGLGGRKSYP